MRFLSENIGNASPGNATLFCALALTLAACSKAPEAAKPRASVAPVSTYEASVPVMTPEANEALKERLARQEAAAKLFDKSKPETPPAPAAKAAPVVAAPAIAPAPAPTPPPVAARMDPAPAPVKAAPVEPPRPAPAPVAAIAPPPPAVAAPTPAPAPSAIAPARLLSRADLDFPREAMQAGVERGLVKARMTLDGNGNVTKVEVIEATPRRLFDRAVVRSLVNWRFSEGPSGRTVETDVEFRR